MIVVPKINCMRLLCPLLWHLSCNWGERKLKKFCAQKKYENWGKYAKKNWIWGARGETKTRCHSHCVLFAVHCTYTDVHCVLFALHWCALVSTGVHCALCISLNIHCISCRGEQIVWYSNSWDRIVIFVLTIDCWLYCHTYLFTASLHIIVQCYSVHFVHCSTYLCSASLCTA